MQRVGGSNKPVAQILIEELSEGTHLHTEEGIHLSNRRFYTFFKFYLEVVRVVRQQSAGPGLVENILELVIIFRNTREIYGFNLSRVARNFRVGNRNCKNSITR